MQEGSDVRELKKLSAQKHTLLFSAFQIFHLSTTSSTGSAVQISCMASATCWLGLGPCWHAPEQERSLTSSCSCQRHDLAPMIGGQILSTCIKCLDPSFHCATQRYGFGQNIIVLGLAIVFFPCRYVVTLVGNINVCIQISETSGIASKVYHDTRSVLART